MPNFKTITRSQSDKLAETFAADKRVLIDWAMRYGSPSIIGAFERLKAHGCGRILVAPLYFRGQMELGTVVQAGVAFGQVLGAMSIIVVHFGTLSSLAAVTTRVGVFWDSIERANGPQGSSEQLVELREGSGVSFDSVTLLTPARERVIVK